VVIVDDARAFVGELAAVSRAPVAYAELPGAQHVFDLYHSIRLDAVIPALERFTRTVLDR
jgi:hypothetical protein